MKIAIMEKTENGVRLHHFEHLAKDGRIVMKVGFSKLVLMNDVVDPEQPSCKVVEIQNEIISEPYAVKLIQNFCKRKFTSFVYQTNGEFYVQTDVEIPDEYKVQD